MTEGHRFTLAGAGPSQITAEVVGRFIAAFLQPDPSLIPDLVATDCTMEAIQPAPNGQRVEGYEANVAFWQATVADRASAPSAAPRTTTEVIQRFNDAFQRHDPTLLAELIAADCIIENTTPAPNGARFVGKKACLELWSRLATSPGMHFDIEEVFVAGERAIIRWRLRWGEGESKSVRGVNVMRVRDGLIVEALGYIKGA